MAQRRMFSPDIVESDEFYSMPVSSQALYFHLGMNADDDGFIQPRMIMRAGGYAEDDLKVLLAKRFLLIFESGVVVIKNWLIHNMIRSDRYKETRFLEEKNTLKLKKNKAYTDNNDVGCQIGNQPAPQVRLGKVRLGKVSEEENTPQKKLNYLLEIPERDINEFIEKFNVTPLKVKEKGEDFYNYCVAKGRDKGFYKNYKSALRNAIKNDFGIRPPQDKELQARIKATQEKVGGSSQFAKELKNKFLIK